MIKKTQAQRGFSLTEVLLAVGILAVGMLFIAGVFPVGIHFMTVSTERTMASIVADEAFAKIKLRGININDANFTTNPINYPGINVTPQALFEYVTSYSPSADEYAYPSTSVGFDKKRYFWSAVCRETGPTDMQVTVFVSRKTGVNQLFYSRVKSSTTLDTPRVWPVAVPLLVRASPSGRLDELLIINLTGNELKFVNDGYTILDGSTGRIQRVLQRYAPPNDGVIHLDSDWQGGYPGLIWVVPSSTTGGRYPCIAVYQKVMRF
jgi:prepilin-type N-terminal cleavage/methylation domain-containing protein